MEALDKNVVDTLVFGLCGATDCAVAVSQFCGEGVYRTCGIVTGGWLRHMRCSGVRAIQETMNTVDWFHWGADAINEVVMSKKAFQLAEEMFRRHMVLADHATLVECPEDLDALMAQPDLSVSGHSSPPGPAYRALGYKSNLEVPGELMKSDLEVLTVHSAESLHDAFAMKPKGGSPYVAYAKQKSEPITRAKAGEKARVYFEFSSSVQIVFGHLIQVASNNLVPVSTDYCGVCLEAGLVSRRVSEFDILVEEG